MPPCGGWFQQLSRKLPPSGLEGVGRPIEVAIEATPSWRYDRLENGGSKGKAMAYAEVKTKKE